ncbi:MAG: manganese efflux pump, partial [Lachnospiraceae bacterium]|nr:manganese efflux pump [Lachnospiraceae bacterium]
MGIIELVFLSVGLAMDAFAVSICKGLEMPVTNYKRAGIIALFFGAFQAG